jgi:hypothetical protein
MQLSFRRINTRKLRFYATLALLYLLPIGFGWYVVKPLPAFAHARIVSLTRQQQKPFLPVVHNPQTFVSGLPVRIVIPDSSYDGNVVDLPIDPGYYDATSNAWNLSGTRAQFAMISTLANNQSGETFIYGHNNDYVFGALRHNTPAVGAQALLYTSNGHIFAYSFTSVNSVGPDDVDVLNYYGPSQLTIQTCTGSLNELRTFYHFSFNKVVQ